MIERFGVLGVFLLMVPESACIPIPSELTLLFSGFAVHQGWMSLPAAVLAATAGNLVGIAARLRARRQPRAQPDRGRTRSPAPLGRAARAPRDAGGVRRPAAAAGADVRVAAGGAEHIALTRFVALTALGCALWAVGFIVAGCSLPTRGPSLHSILGTGAARRRFRGSPRRRCAGSAADRRRRDTIDRLESKSDRRGCFLTPSRGLPSAHVPEQLRCRSGR